VLDLVMALREPKDGQPGDQTHNGAHFELHVEKARGLTGEAIEPIEARIETDNLGVARWQWQPLHQTTLDRFVALVHEGLNALQAGRELSLSHGATYRLRNKARRLGLLKSRRTNP
jgi:hypothetical protein